MPDHLRTQCDQLFGERSVSATQVEDALARLRLKQVHHRLPERGHEVRVGRISGRIPGLGGRRLRR